MPPLPPSPQCPRAHHRTPLHVLSAFPSCSGSSSRASSSAPSSPFFEDIEKREVVHAAAYKYPTGATMECIGHMVTRTDTRSLVLPVGAYAPPRHPQNEIDAVPNIKILDGMEYLNARVSGCTALRLAPRVRTAQKASTLGPPPLARDRGVPPQRWLPSHPRVQGGWMMGRHRRWRRRADGEPHDPLGTGSCSRICGGMNLAHVIMCVMLVAARSRAPLGRMDKGKLRDGPAAMDCTLCACPPHKSAALPQAHRLRLARVRRPHTSPADARCGIAISCRLSLHRGQGGGADIARGEGNCARAGEEGDWERERARDAEGSMEVALVGPLASRWEEQEQECARTPPAVPSVQVVELCARAPYRCSFVKLRFVSRNGHPIATKKRLQTCDHTFAIQQIEVEDITDKSNINCLTHFFQYLPVTQLDVATLAFAVLNVLIWSFWWAKPLDVEQPILVGSTEELQDAGPIIPPVSLWDTFWAVLSGDYIFRLPLASTSLPTFWSVDWDEADPGDADISLYTEYLVGTVFGAIRCAAWNSYFPSAIEMGMWRSSSLLVVSIQFPPSWAWFLHWSGDRP
ncbi:hypothetical protein B0H16DRAFT_1728165 [Mycena metata]|uniref:Uncharacterized protein n=1 Tax=Mycena metata TaxID=1033252 RepID=A0AAD7IIV6_9AGAR|nr:hypothetical protein B0H16DRAFT_1728165 [Mycena metata]